MKKIERNVNPIDLVRWYLDRKYDLLERYYFIYQQCLHNGTTLYMDPLIQEDLAGYEPTLKDVEMIDRYRYASIYIQVKKPEPQPKVKAQAN